MTFRRRDLVRTGLGLAAAGLAAGPFGRALAAVGPARRLAFDNLHTGEKVDAVYFENGAYVPDALNAIDKVLRDHRSGEVHPMDRGLLDLLSALSGQLERPPGFQVISGFRSPHTNAMLKKTGGGGVATKSLHMQGKAMDIRVEGVETAALRDAALALKLGGVGYYPSDRFVHVDTGRVRRW